MTSMAMVGSPAQLTDEALAEAARAGDREAFSSLVSRYRDLAFSYAYARLHDRDEAEDVAQETFVRAYVALSHFRTSACWGAWVMQITRNLCKDQMRKRRTRPSVPLDMDWIDAAPTPDAITLTKERRETIAAAVAALPEDLRIPIHMHYGARRTYKEIGLALGLPESTVVGRIAAGMRRLRRRLCTELGL
jgi:RNA polymerase sigma-70 factor, ECF subfamily